MLKLLVTLITFLATGLWFLGVRFPYLDKIAGVGWIILALLLVL